MSKFYQVSDDAKEQFYNVFNKKTFPINVKFTFLGNEKQKELIKIKKIADDYAFLLEKELMVYINEDLLNVFDEESIQILMEQELDKVNINIETGKIKLIKPDLTTFSGIVAKYGIEKVKRALNIETLYEDQQQDALEFQK